MTDPRDLRTPEQVLADAEAFGVDLTLIDAQLARTPEERMRMASDNAELFQAIDRWRAEQSRTAAAAP